MRKKKESNRKIIQLPTSSKDEKALDIAAILSSFAPWVGGAISNVLGGMSLGRKIKRIESFLSELSSEIEKVRTTEAEQFVKTEDFEDLLEQTLKKVADERSEKKRQLYRDMLLNNIEAPELDFDDRLKMLNLLDQLQPTHIELMKALMQGPAAEETRGISGSIMRTLRRRLPNYSEGTITELVNDLERFNLITDVSNGLKGMMTPEGASDLRSRVTGLGERLITFTIQI